MIALIQKYKYLLIYAFALFAYLNLMNNTNVWTDEIFSLRLLDYSWSEMFHLIKTEDGHPPLFYILLRLWMGVTDIHNIFWARLFPMMWIFALAALGPFPIKRLFGKTAGFYFFLMALFMPASFYLGTDIRMYAMAIFFITATLTYAALIARDNKTSDWIKFFLCALAGMYTHYLATLFIGIIYGILFLRLVFRDKKWTDSLTRFFICAGLTAVLFGPWFLIVLNQASNMYQHWAPQLSSVIRSITLFVTPLLQIWHYSAVVFLLVVFLSSIQLFVLLFSITKLFSKQKDPNKSSVASILGAMFLTFLAAVLISLLWRPILAPRYIYLLFGGLWLLYATTLTTHKQLLPVFLIASFCLTPAAYFIRYQTVFDPMRAQLAQMIKNNSTPDTNFICADLHTCFFLIYYQPENKRILLAQKPDQWIFRDLLFNHQPTEQQLRDNPLFILDKRGNCSAPLNTRYTEFEYTYCLSEINDKQKPELMRYIKQHRIKE